jgi:uncharacterized protein YbbC (DUF1343 family)
MYQPSIHHFTQSANKNLRYGIVTNDAATLLDGTLDRKVLLDEGFNLQTIFSPEHGIKRDGADGQFIKDDVDPMTGLPIISLYGKKYGPDGDDLQALDAVIFDVPDIGCRCYTYLWTLTYVMEACAKHKKPLIVLDRPNPLGDGVDGPWLDEATCTSFIGRWSLPMVHGKSLGALARYFNETKAIGCELQVIDYILDGPFISEYFYPTSPAIQHLSTARIYPGTVLFEGLNIDEGRGTGLDFRIFGAPWMDSFKVMEYYKSNDGQYDLEQYNYVSKNGQYISENCRGVRILNDKHPDDRPFSEGCKLIRAIYHSHTQQLKLANYMTNANPKGERHLDLLVGLPRAFEKILGCEI